MRGFLLLQVYGNFYIVDVFLRFITGFNGRRVEQSSTLHKTMSVVWLGKRDKDEFYFMNSGKD